MLLMDENRQKELELIARMAAEKTIKKHSEKLTEKRNRWLRNTKKLMEKYNILREHSEKSVLEILDTDLKECLTGIVTDEERTELTISSIERSKLRTYIITEHISKMMDILLNIYRQKQQLRKYRVLRMRYIEEKDYIQIAKKENVDERTVYRDLNDALDDLSVLLFGIDGMFE